ncbi:MAG: MFS transporter [Trueperaceae bacterium]|nr:MAG: MFS transporter [Trueperaceae bacterium]
MQRLSRVKQIYFAAEFLGWFGVGLVLPVSILLLQSRGLDLFEIGLLMGMYSLTIVVLELPTGGLADAIGRKPVTLLSYLFALASSLAFLVSFSMTFFVLSFVLLGVSRALASGALGSWFVDQLLEIDGDIDLQPPLAHANVFVIAGLCLGSLAGGWIPRRFDHLATDSMAVFTPLSMTLVFSIGIKLVNLMLVSLAVKEQRGSASLRPALGQIPSQLSTAFVEIRQNPTIMLVLATTFGGALALMSVETFWQPRFAGWLGSENTHVFGLLMTGAFTVGIIGNLASIPLSKWLKGRHALVAALAQAGGGMAVILLAFQTDSFTAAAFFWLFYLTGGVLGSPVAAIFNREVPSERRSSMQSVMSLAGYAGSFLGSAALGYVAKVNGIGTVWFVSGLILAASAGLFLLIDNRTRVQGTVDPGDHAPVAGG